MNTGHTDCGMTEENDNDSMVKFLESEIFSEEAADEDIPPEPQAKRPRYGDKADRSSENACSSGGGSDSINKDLNLRVERIMSNLPPELFPYILKFLSSEDLMACSKSCRFLNFAASDESLWRRLYCIRWGLFSQSNKMRQSAWKKLYIQRDEEDMVEFVRTCQTEFKEYYIQMQAAKRTQAPLLSQVNDDRIILDKTVSDQVSLWRSSKGFTDKVATNHACSGVTCSYHMIGDVYVCEKTGHVHVCDDACREVVMDPSNEPLVCTISGHCFDRMLSPDEMGRETQGVWGTDDFDPEPFMGSGRFGNELTLSLFIILLLKFHHIKIGDSLSLTYLVARAYLLGYNCDDEKELDAVLKFC